MGEIVHTHRYQKAKKTKGESELTRERAGAVRANRLRSEMLLSKARDELIEKDLVLKQAAYLLIAMRQKMLSAPQTYARQLVGITDPHVMVGKLREMMISMLNELKDLPLKVTDQNWLESLEETESGKT